MTSKEPTHPSPTSHNESIATNVSSGRNELNGSTRTIPTTANEVESSSNNTTHRDEIDHSSSAYYEQTLSLMQNQLHEMNLSEPLIPQLKHWTEVMYECNDIVLEDWAIAGGSDYGQLHYFITTGDILLEIDGQRIAGLTRADVLRLISKQSSHTIKAVSSSSSFGLPIDLKEYLSRRFVRGSIDYDLQANIRDNVYLRTVPCTTRPPRSNEVNGVDYKFVSRQEFAEMERSGVLLESGIYAGHYYGTPLPLAEALPPAGIQSPAHTPTNTQTNSANSANATNDKQAFAESNSKAISNQPSALALKRRRNRSNIAAIDASSLPHGWERISDAHYGVYYIDHINKRTQYERPYELELSKGPTGFGFTLVEVDSGLAVVKSILPGGAAFTSGVIQPGDVLVSVSGVSVAGLQHSDIAKLFATFSSGDRVKLTFARGYALPPEVLKEQQPMQTAQSNSVAEDDDFELIPLTIVKGAQGFGFTISDGGPGFQRVKKILDVERCGPLQQGDILAIVNNIDLSTLSHIQVVDIIKNHCQIGDSTSFAVKRYKNVRAQANACEKLRSKTPGADLGADYNREACTLPSRNCKTPSAELLRKQIAGWSGAQANSTNNTMLHMPTNSQAMPTNPPHYDQTNSAYSSYAMNGYANSAVSLTSGLNGSSVNTSPPTNSNVYPNGYANDYNNTYANTNMTSAAYVDHSPDYQSQVCANLENVNNQPYVGGYGNESNSQFDNDNSGEDEFEYFRVCLQRGEAGFGFRIVGGAEESRSVTIGSIVIGGVAHLDGILRAGDELISINDRNVMNASHHHVVDLMAECGMSASLLVRRRKFCDAFDVQLVRDPNEGFGFVIISCGQCALIGRIIEQSPAARCQRLKIRDKIIAVNGIDITQMSHPEIVNMIKESGLMLRLRIVPADCYTVELIRGPKGFGFSIRGGAEFNGMPLFILRVAPDGPAWSLLNVGDEIIEINGISTVDVTHSQAVLWISQSGPQVKLKLRKRELLSPGSSGNPVVGGLEPSNTMMSLNSTSSLNAMANGSNLTNPIDLNRMPLHSPATSGYPVDNGPANHSNNAYPSNSTYSAY